ncbi:MAG: hypothetical protein M3268_08420, partial [Acidobacteriota bacterium]|nr:hypothetical protein [Acidobacteriota bacterium]
MRDRKSQRGIGRRAHARAAMLPLCAALVAVIAVRAGSTRVASAQERPNDNAVALDLPASGEVRIENQRGGVTLEVWGEDYLSVAYVPEGAARAGDQPSPVRLERADNVLSVTIPRETNAGSTTARATT